MFRYNVTINNHSIVVYTVKSSFPHRATDYNIRVRIDRKLYKGCGTIYRNRDNTYTFYFDSVPNVKKIHGVAKTALESFEIIAKHISETILI